MAIGKLPFPVVAPPSAPAARRLGRTFANNGEGSGLTASVTPPAPTRRRNVKASSIEIKPNAGCGKVAKLAFAGEPFDAMAAAAIRQHAGERGQQHPQLALERPGRIDHDQPAGGTPAGTAA